MNLLKDKSAFITGAASGIGRAAALRFAAEGAKVAIADRDESDAAKVVEEIQHTGGTAIATECDITDPEEVQLAIQKTVDTFGRLDIVYANAGINGVWAPIEDLKPTEWDTTLNINLKGTFLTVHYAIPHLKKSGGGSILITSSVNGTRTFTTAGAAAYSSSKAGQVAFMKMAALELGRHNIRVNAICPGAIHTNINDSTKKRNIDEIKFDIEMPSGNPALHHGQGDPDEVADVCLFLASDLSRHVSGVDIYVDGGASLL
jgi:NAD(P)-dependent dehydrogenase (short-subunit alcohol dehydrogenase family)